jgi:DNA-directed RNA polymerase subunit RPC12/RpoP
MQTFPPPGFVQIESALPGIDVYMPTPEQTEQVPDILDFKCPQCQATTAYSIADGGVKCAHCGYYEPPAQPIVGKGAEEFEFTVETMVVAVQAQGWGEARKELQCQNCSARTTLPPGRLTSTCPFCGSNRVLQQDAPQDSLRPRFLIPFKLDEAACTARVRTWLGSSWMTPKALNEMTRVTQFIGVYVPFWTFDALTEADWRAEVGHQETRRYYDAGSKSWKSRTVTVWKWESGRAHELFDDVLISGTARLSDVLLSRIRDYDTQELVPYDPHYLAGFMAQAYDVPLDSAWETVREEMREHTRRACRAQASTSRIRNFSMSLDFENESWRYVLTPLYISVYRYEGETYQVMVNGQTGVVSGQRPVAWNKVWLAIAAMLSPAAFFGLVGLVLLLLMPPLGIAGLVIALVALIIGGIFAVMTYKKAEEMDDV